MLFKKTFTLIAVLLVLAMPIFAQEPNPASDFEFSLNQAGTGVVISGFIGTGTAVVIPAEIEGFPVVQIANNAFRNSRITSVVFPDTRITIGAGAFQNSRLTHVTIPNTIGGIGGGAFSDLPDLVSVTFYNSVTNLDWNPRGTFANNRNLTTVTFSGSWVRIPDYMFVNCFNLTTVTFPSGLRNIGRAAFLNTTLTEIVLPEGIETIGIRAFAVTHPMRIFPTEWEYHASRFITAGNNALANRSSIETLTIPEGVTRIYTEAFSNRRITTLVLPSTTSRMRIYADAFARNGITEVLVPEDIRFVHVFLGRERRGVPRIFYRNSINLQGQAALRRAGYTSSF